MVDEAKKLGFYETKIQLKNGQWIFIEPLPAETGMAGRHIPKISVRSTSSIGTGGDTYEFKDKEYSFNLEFTTAHGSYERGVHKGKWSLRETSVVIVTATRRELKTDHPVFVALVATAKDALNRWEKETPEWRKVSAHRKVLARIDDYEIRVERIREHLAKSLEELDELEETRSILEAEIPDWLE